MVLSPFKAVRCPRAHRIFPKPCFDGAGTASGIRFERSACPVSIRAEGVTLAQHPVFAIYDMDWVSSPEFRQRLAVTALCLSVYLALGAIPLPGLYQEGVRSLEQSVPLRFSLLALGISPLFSAYLLFELLRLGVPRLRRWLDSSPACRTTGQRFVIGSAIAMTAVQAAGIASTMEGFPGLVRAPGIEFRIGFIVALTGATVVSIALAQIIGRHGLGGGLVWGMAALSAAGFAPQSFASSRLAGGRGSSGPEGSVAINPGSFWPLFLAPIMGSLLLAPLVRFMPDDAFVRMYAWAAPLLSMLLIFLFCWLYERAMRADHPSRQTERGAFAQAAIPAAGLILVYASWQAGFRLQPAALAVPGAMALLVLTLVRWLRRPA
jgi:hypothetical protein